MKADFELAGVKEEPLVTPYVVPTSGLYYGAFLCIGGRVPTVAQSNWLGNAPAYSSFPIGAGKCLWAEMVDQTEIPSVVSLDPPSSPAPSALWFGVK